MTLFKLYGTGLLVAALALSTAACRSGSGTGGGNAETVDTTRPVISSTSVAGHATNVALDRSISATFSKPMDASTINSSTFMLTVGDSGRVPGDVTCTDTVATFTPWVNLSSGATFTVRIAKQVSDLAGNSMAEDAVWTFQTGIAVARGPSLVPLGNAGNFLILAQSMISNTGDSSIRGDIGLSPGEASRFTGFSNKLDPSGQYSYSSTVVGRIYASDYSSPTPGRVEIAVLDMQAAYSDAYARKNPDSKNQGDGTINRVTLNPGLHTWNSDLNIENGITFLGGPNDVWIIQVAKELNVSNGVIVTLAGEAQARNIFWVVTGQVILGTNTEFKGIVLSKEQITLRKGASLLGRALSQTTVTLDAATVTAP